MRASALVLRGVRRIAIFTRVANFDIYHAQSSLLDGEPELCPEADLDDKFLNSAREARLARLMGVIVAVRLRSGCFAEVADDDGPRPVAIAVLAETQPVIIDLAGGPGRDISPVSGCLHRISPRFNSDQVGQRLP